MAAVVAAFLPGSRRIVVGIRRNMTLELDENRKKKGKLIKHETLWAQAEDEGRLDEQMANGSKTTEKFPRLAAV